MTANETQYILAGGDNANTNGQVTVKGTATEAELEAAKTSKPTLTFKAYAIQSANMADANDAWTKLNTEVDAKN